MNPQICLIHGGEPHNSYKDFLQELKTSPIRKPYFESTQKQWKDDLCLYFSRVTDVLYPSMPNKQNARYDEWRIWFERHFDYITSHIILIGHSLGAIFLVKYLSENEVPFHVKALYIISAPHWTLQERHTDFQGFAFDKKKLKKIEDTADNIYILHSMDDEIVPVSHGTAYKEALPSAKYIELRGRGHFLDGTFPELKTSIEELL